MSLTQRAEVEADEGCAVGALRLAIFQGVDGLRETGFLVGAAMMQVARAGSEEQVAKTREILEETRRRIYELLAGEEETED